MKKFFRSGFFALLTAAGCFVSAAEKDILSDTDEPSLPERVPVHSNSVLPEAGSEYAAFARSVQLQKKAAIPNLLKALEKDPGSPELAAVLLTRLNEMKKEEIPSCAGSWIRLAQEHTGNPMLTAAVLCWLEKNARTEEWLELACSFLRHCFQQPLPPDPEDIRFFFAGATLEKALPVDLDPKSAMQIFDILEDLDPENDWLKQKHVQFLVCRFLFTASEKADPSVPPLLGWLFRSDRDRMTCLRDRILREFLQNIQPGVEFHPACQCFLHFLTERKKTAEADAFLAELILKFPDEPDVWKLCSEVLFARQNFLPAVEAVGRQVRLLGEKASPDLWSLYGMLLAELGFREQAVPWMEKVLRGGFRPLKTRAFLMDLYMSLERYQDVLEQLKHFPPSPENRITAGLCLLKLNRKADGVKFLLSGYRDLPEKLKRKQAAATAALLEDSGELVSAIQILEAELKKNPDDPELQNTLGFILADHNIRLDFAETLLRKAAAKLPDNAAVLDSMAWVLYRKGNFQEASGWILKSLASVEEGKSPEGEILDHAGDIFFALGEYEPARKFWTDAYTDPGNLDPEKILLKLQKLKIGSKTDKENLK